MTELDLIIDFHVNSDRQGPGSEDDTLKALGFLNLPTDRQLKVADIGCGSGGQTITLANNINGHITAIDLVPAFLKELDNKTQNSGLTHKITTLETSMENLPFSNGELDLIWSEGAIYNIGFNAGIRKWKDYLHVGGYLAVSEITWISRTRPREIEEFWKSEYPEIDIASNKIKALENNEYTLAGYFYLSQKSWIDNYYRPMEAKFDAYLERHQNSKLASKVVDDHRTEIDMYRKFKDYYSYGFYIARKN